MEQSVIKCLYEGKEVEFDLSNDNVMINATEMALIFGKRIDVFMKSEHVSDFIEAFNSTQNTPKLASEFPPYGVNSSLKDRSKIIQTRGQNGTWMHRVLAIKFAAWLNPHFEVWVYSTIDQIMFGELRNRKNLLSQYARLSFEISELEQQLADNDLYKTLVDKKAERLRLGKDLKANDIAQTAKQVALF
jgi:hypothetical protein